MKKRILACLLACLTVVSPVASAMPVMAATAAATTVAAAATTTSELTGLPISSAIAAQRPVAVMIDNDTRALPHYGLAEADVVYEMMNSTANNRVTRLMALYKDWQTVNQIGNIRSTRPTNILLASEWNAILIHDGGPFYNNPYFTSTGLNHLSGSFSRVKNGKSSEFTEYAKGNEILRRVNSAKFSSTYTNAAAMQHWTFATTDLTTKGGITANLCQLGCFKLTSPYLVYNTTTGTYDYYENGKLSQDGEDSQVVTFKNVILQDATFTQYDKNGYLIYNVIGTGMGWYMTNGKAIPIIWVKSSETGITKYYDATGAEITLNPGKTYIGICPADDWDSVKIG